jgi:hypothetical protein
MPIQISLPPLAGAEPYDSGYCVMTDQYVQRHIKALNSPIPRLTFVRFSNAQPVSPVTLETLVTNIALDIEWNEYRVKQ